MESKQRTPSVIARLMGLDELPPRQPVHKPQRVLSENYLRKTASIGLLEKRSFFEGPSYGINVEKQQEFKDVFEVPEIPDKCHIQAVQKKKAKSSLTEAKMALIGQKFTDAKRLSVDEKLQHSKEFNDVLEDLDSNKDLLLRYLEQPESLFTKHLSDLQGDQPHSQSGHTTLLNSSNVLTYRNNEKCKKTGKKTGKTTAQPMVLRSSQKLENGFVTDSFGELDIDYLHKLKSQLELEDETCLHPTKIVVLKPNFGKVNKSARCSFLPGSHLGSQSGDTEHKEFPRSKNGDLYNKVRERESSANNFESSRHSFRVSRGIAKEITRQIRHNISSNSTEVSKSEEVLRSEFRVYNTSANESEVMRPSCPNIFDWKKQNQTSYSFSNGSSLVREARKRLSERWKMTKSFEEVGVASRSCTLGEMLAMPDQETRPRILNHRLDNPGLCSQFSLNGGNADLGTPLGISSKDGWKDEFVRKSPRSSLPASTAIGTPKSRTRNEAFCNDGGLRLEEAVTGGENKFVKLNFPEKDSSKPRDSGFNFEKSQSSPSMDLENNHTIQETHVSLDERKNKPEEEDLCEENSAVSKLSSSNAPCSDSYYNHPLQRTQVIRDDLDNSFEKNNLSKDSENISMVLNSSISNLASLSMIADIVADAETKNFSISSGIHEEQQSEPTAHDLLVKDGNSSSHVWNSSTRQESSIGLPEDGLVASNCTRIDPELSMSLGEAYPSPNSVLEPPFKEEISFGSECFESVNADLHGLQMQLQLLKSVSEDTESEASGMAVSSDEDTGEGSIDLSERNRKAMGLFRAEESRDFSYLIDVLDEVGFYGRNLEMGFETWHSPECPLHPSVFEALEKKYGMQTSWEKSERRLLFDRINSGLMEILQLCMDIHMWEKPLRKRLSATLRRDVVEEELWMLLVSQEKDASKDLSEKALGREMRWLELRDDIDVIGTEIENFLFDELVVELAMSIESF